MKTQSEQSRIEEFSSGNTVVYGMHGKCHVLGVESRKIGGEEIRFYKLEKHHYGIAKPKRQAAAIWIPVNSAAESGLRRPLDQGDIDEVMKILESREYYFSLDEKWNTVLPKLEEEIRKGGPTGLAKVVSYLFVLTQKQIVPPGDAIKFQDSVNKLLFRELSDASGEPISTIEANATKLMRQKLLPDS